MKSYFSNRQCYVEIQGYKSKTRPIGDKSVIQGSKCAMFLYTIHTLDIGKLNQVLQRPDTQIRLTNNDLPESEDNKHDSIVYVDDMSQIVANKNKMLLQTFIQQMYKITVLYFETNR